MLNVLEVLKGKAVSLEHLEHIEHLEHLPLKLYSTVTDFARFLGWSTFAPRFTAM